MFYLFAGEHEGQGLVEYAIILILIAIVIVAILTVYGTQIGNLFSRVTSAIEPY